MKKQEIIKELKVQLEKRKLELMKNLSEIKAEMANETKSSAGDKFETSREMMNQSKNATENQLAKLDHQLNELQSLPLKALNKVEYGALVETENSTILMGIALGKVTLKEGTIFALSMIAPITKSMLGKVVGDTITIGAKSQTIKSIS